MSNLLNYKSFIKATIITIIMGISASQMIAYAGTPIPQTGWSVWLVDSERAPNYAATNAFDGDINTIWHTDWNPTAQLPHDLQIDLGANHNIEGFVYTPRQDGVNGRIGQYEFYVSGDGGNWGTAAATGTFANDATEKEVIGNTSSGRYIWLRALSEVNGGPWTSAAEINVLCYDCDPGGGGGDCDQIRADLEKLKNDLQTIINSIP